MHMDANGLSSYSITIWVLNANTILFQVVSGLRIDIA